VIGIRLGLRLGRKGVSIVPDGDSAGRAHLPFTFQNPEFDNSNRMRLYLERQTMCCFAGIEAVRQLNPRSIRHYHASGDYQQAVDLLSRAIFAPDELSAYLKFCQLRTRNLVNSKLVWAQITAVADALLEQQHLSRAEVENVVKATIQAMRLAR